MPYRWISISAFLLAATAILGGAVSVGAADVTVEEGIVYVERGDLKLELDLARPAEGGSIRPAVVCIHGGGWVGGHRRGYARL